MADGSRQSGFNFPTKPLVSALRAGEIVVDFFAGGGGASEALRQALGRDPDVAVNHDRLAIGMHAANHPFTRHMEADVWTVDILREVAGRPVGWFHASPDCTHFSQAKGGQPRDRATRSLSWVVPKVAGALARRGLAPRIISLENVRQILGWCPLVAKRDKSTGRVITLDMVPMIDAATGKPVKRAGKIMMVNRIADPGEQVPLRNQFLVPDKRRLGETWRKFNAVMHALGYVGECRLLKACDYGAGTSRERLFGIWRRDGEPIRWPEPTHGPGRATPYVTAADCIDWSIPCPSIFARKRALADATCKRIAKGIHRYVLGAAEPFIVQCANASANGVASGGEPLGTVTGWPKGGSHALAAARPAGAAHAMGVMTAFLEQANGGGEHGNPARARGADEPVSAITGTGSQQRVVTADLAHLAPEHEAGALRVAAFLINYYGNGQALDLRDPVDTVTTRDRLALVTVTIKGTPYVIVDIGLRMLRREELFRAQGFPADYIIDRTADGTLLSISASVRMVGNSVSPPPLCALARANLDPVREPERLAA